MNNLNEAWAVKLNYMKGFAGKYYFYDILNDYTDRPRTQLFPSRKACRAVIRAKNIDGKPVRVRIAITEVKKND
jgi:hypothetical protein